MFTDSPFNPVSPQAHSISNLFVVTLIVMGMVILLVTSLVLYAAVRFRARPGRAEPKQQFGIPRLEIGWTVATALVLMVFFGFTVTVMNSVEPSDAHGGAIVVIGHQWWWEVRYPGTGVVTANEIHLPVGQRMLVSVTSDDVIHDLWLPQLGGKMDLVPGQTNHMYLEADQAGTYFGACAEFCGAEHAWMYVRAIAQPPAQYQAWLNQQKQADALPASGLAAAGAKLFSQLSCAACHVIYGTTAQAQIGPNLSHVGSRQTLAAGLLSNTAANMAAWIRDPQALKPGTHMPDLQLSSQQVSILTAYLESLK